MLIKCPECGKDISSHSPTCIHCGYPITTHEENAPSPVVESQETEEPHVDTPVEEVVEEAVETDDRKPVRWISCPHCKSGLYTVERPVCISCGETVDVKPFRYGGIDFDISYVIEMIKQERDCDACFELLRQSYDERFDMNMASACVENLKKKWRIKKKRTPVVAQLGLSYLGVGVMLFGLLGFFPAIYFLFNGKYIFPIIYLVAFVFTGIVMSRDAWK